MLDRGSEQPRRGQHTGMQRHDYALHVELTRERAGMHRAAAAQRHEAALSRSMPRFTETIGFFPMFALLPDGSQAAWPQTFHVSAHAPIRMRPCRLPLSEPAAKIGSR